MKAIILARVSTEEQKDAGNSLPAQIERIKAYCIRKGFEVTEDRIFSLDESAYKIKRDEFDKILEYLETHKEKIAVCFDKVDRLSRNIFDKRVSFLYGKALSGEIELHFVSDGQILNTEMSATQKFQFGMSLDLAKYYSDAISDNVRRAYEQKRRNGEWTGKAPIGYLNVASALGKRDIIPDPERAPFLQRIFELYATGEYSIRTLRDKITAEGLKSTLNKRLASSVVEHILKNPFYYGEMLSRGEIYPHKYSPLISRELFEQCSKVRLGWKKKPFKYAAKPYVLRGLVRCAKCGCAISPEIHKGLIYYSCTNAKGTCKKEYVREEVLLEPVYTILDRFGNLSEERVNEVVIGLRDSNQAKKDFQQEAIGVLRRRYDALQGRLDKLLELFLDDQITQEEYQKNLSNIKQEQQSLNLKIEEHTRADESYLATAGLVLHLARHARSLFDRSEVHEKRALLGLLFQNSVVEGKKPLYTLRSPFDTILQIPEYISLLRG